VNPIGPDGIRNGGTNARARSAKKMLARRHARSVALRITNETSKSTQTGTRTNPTKKMIVPGNAPFVSPSQRAHLPDDHKHKSDAIATAADMPMRRLARDRGNA
jgi:hypothetical protein